jgi:tetratricopeptide (TPR) repeat protein
LISEPPHPVDSALACDDFDREEVPERYVAGTLPEEVAAAFEAHYFGCERCFERSRMLRDVRTALGSQAGAASGRDRTVRRLAIGLAAAAVLIVTVRVALDRRSDVAPGAPVTSAARGDVTLPAPAQSSTAASSELSALSALEAPPYVAPRLRSAETDGRRLFREAMDAYQRGEYREAIPALEQSAAVDSEPVATDFFLAVCYLMTGQHDAGVARLRRVIDHGESPYLEEARLLLAKAMVRRGELEGAGRELQTIVAMHGEHGEEAERLLRALRR